MSMPSRRVSAVVGVAALSILLTACSGAAVSGNKLGPSGAASVNGIDTSECPDGFNTKGITDTEVKIGSSMPLTGSVGGVGAGNAAGFNAYIKKVNDTGGVKMADGKRRKIVVTVLDDGYEPSRARVNMDQLINGKGVFALVVNYGTPGNLAARPLVSESCIPDLWMTSGHNEFGNPAFPWMAAPLVASYSGDAQAAAQYMAEKNPTAKIAVLRQNDDLGSAYFAAFTAALKGTKAKVVATETFDPTDTAVSAQITTLANSGADDFIMLSGNGTYVLQALQSIAQSSWRPKIKYMTSFSIPYLDQLGAEASTDVFFGQSYKSTEDPSYADDAALKEYLDAWNKTPGTQAFSTDGGLLGWQAGMFLEDALERAKEPTRLGFLQAATHVDWTKPSMLLKDVKYALDYPEEAYGIQSEVIVTYDPNGPAGRKIKPVKVIDNTGKIKFQNLTPSP
jgi:branched-chain amino acid transport system substrate-binding protein